MFSRGKRHHLVQGGVWVRLRKTIHLPFHTQPGRVSASGASTGKLGRWNPIRHRVLSPFISFPGIVLAPQGLFDVHMYLYMHLHESGLSWWILSLAWKNMEEKLQLVSTSCNIQVGGDFLMMFLPFLSLLVLFHHTL